MPRVTPTLYFHWLCGQIYTPREGGRWDLFSEMHNTVFTWSVPNDDNRIADAVELRNQFYRDRGAHVEDDMTASVLEVLIALSQRISFDDDGPADRWAWELIKNLTLHRRKFMDPLTSKQADEVQDILAKLIWRQYSSSGEGGFFPLAFPTRDQRQVEVWYQMAAYLEEQHPEWG